MVQKSRINRSQRLENYKINIRNMLKAYGISVSESGALLKKYADLINSNLGDDKSPTVTAAWTARMILRSENVKKYQE